MKHDAKKMIRNFQLLPDVEKDKVYSFILVKGIKDLNTKAKKLAKFGIQSIRKLQELNKRGNRTLSKSIKLRNELGI